MTHDDLATLLRDDLSRTEPLGLPDVAVPLAAGRARVRRRRAVSATLAAGALAVAGALAAPLLGADHDGDGSTGRVIDPAERSLASYDPQQMPLTLEQRARAVLERSVASLGPGDVHVGDGQGDRLAPKDYDKASGMSVSFGSDEHEWSVSLDHAKSEAEGSAREYCATGLADGSYLECTVDTDAHGYVVISKLWAMRPMGTRPNDRLGFMVVPADRLDRVRPDRLYFERSVKVVKSASLVTYAQERVHAPTGEAAEAAFVVPVADLVELGADPALVIPEPPVDDSGCGPWTQDPGVSYSC